MAGCMAAYQNGGKKRRSAKRHARKSRRHHRKSARKQAGGFLQGLGETLYTAAVPFGLYGAQKSLHKRITRKQRGSRRA
jgi:hypothetical protein